MLKFLLWLLVLFSAHLLVSGFLVSTVVIETESMHPGIQPGDRLLVLSQHFKTFFPGFSGDASRRIQNFKRGDLVIISRSAEKQSVFSQLADRTLRFFSAQRAGLGSAREKQPYIKRLVGFPGDTIEMSQYILKIQEAGSSFALTEFELTETQYDVDLPAANPLWDSSLPFSGAMQVLVLGPDECFVVSDDRMNTNDSRTWGPLPVDQIRSRPVFRYWPISRFGRL